MSIQQAAFELTNPLAYASTSKLHELMARVRLEQPVCYVEPEGYDPVWLGLNSTSSLHCEVPGNSFVYRSLFN